MPTKSAEGLPPLPVSDQQILRMPAVEQLTGMSRTQIYSEIREGSFPQPIELGTKIRGWRLSAVEAWLAARPAPNENSWKPPVCKRRPGEVQIASAPARAQE